MSIEELLDRFPVHIKSRIPHYGTPAFTQFIRFCIVGASNTGLQLTLLYSFVEFLSLNYLVATSIAFVIAASNSFFWNRLWTFREGRRYGAHLQWAGFMAISTFGFCLNFALMYALVDLLGVWYMLSQFLVAFMVALNNFFGSKYLVFRK